MLLLLMDRPFLPVNLKWLKSNHYLHHCHSPLYHQDSVHHSWWLCRYDILQLCFLFLVYCDSRKASQLTFLHYSGIPFFNHLEKEKLVQIKKKMWSSVQSFIFYKMERCHLYNASGKTTGYKNRNEGVNFLPLRLLAA